MKVWSTPYINTRKLGVVKTGKSTLISILCLYEFYNLIALKNPAKYYSLLPGSPIAILAIAQSQDQVKETLFKAIKGYAEGSLYFKGLIKSGKVELGAEEIKCDEKKVSIFAKHTNSKSLVGYSVKCLILDEAARFEYDEFGKSKADGIWDNVGRACSSRFGTEGKKIAISSAWEPGDYIEKLYEVTERSITSIGFRLKTWQVNLNPNSSETSLKASEDYVKDPIAAATEYEGARTVKQGTFFSLQSVKSCFKGQSACDAKAIPLDITNREGETRKYTGIEITRLVNTTTPSFAHCDYGIKKDGAAFAVSSPQEIEPNTWGISVDVILLWKPHLDRDKDNKGFKRIVSFVNCEEIFLKVCKARKVTKFSFDSFQSESSIQRLHIEGISTCLMSTVNSEQAKYYATSRTLMDHGLLWLPKNSTWSPSAEVELSNIIQLPNGKITHHSNQAKDISDAVVNSVYNCYLYMIQTGILNNNSSLISHISKINSSNSVNSTARNVIKTQGRLAVNKLKQTKLHTRA